MTIEGCLHLWLGVVRLKKMEEAPPPAREEEEPRRRWEATPAREGPSRSRGPDAAGEDEFTTDFLDRID